MLAALLFWIIVGLAAGFLASLTMRGSGYGIIGDIIVGIVGAFIGGFLMNYLGFTIGYSIIVAFIGACILIWISHAVSSTRTRAIDDEMKIVSSLKKTSPPLTQQTSYSPPSRIQQTSYPSPPVQQQPRYAPPTLSLFVSHSSRDDAFGLKLVKDLRREFGGDEAVWYDSEGGLYGGDSWWRRIVSVLDTCDVFVIIISPNSMTSKWVLKELDIATVEGKRIVPILYRQSDAVPADLRAIQHISFLDAGQYNVAFNKLVEALRR